MTDAPAEPSASTDPEALLSRDIRLTWRTLFAFGIPEPYMQELCVDALRAVPRDARGGRTDDPDTRRGVYEAAVMEGAHFGRKFVEHPQAPARLAGRTLGEQERELLQALSDGIAELTMAEQESFRLFEVEGFPLEQIGEMLSLSTDLAKAQLNAARRRLRRSRAAAGRPIQRDTLYALMRSWHNPDASQLDSVRAATLAALASDDSGARLRWLGPVVAILLSAVMLGGLWLLADTLSHGR